MPTPMCHQASDILLVVCSLIKFRIEWWHRLFAFCSRQMSYFNRLEKAVQQLRCRIFITRISMYVIRCILVDERFIPVQFRVRRYY